MIWYVVGGGPSLRQYKWSHLKNKNVIAVNRSFQKLPNAQYTYFSDLRFFEWYKEDLLKHRSKKVTIAKINHPDVIKYQNTGAKGLEILSHGLRSGNNSVYAAMNLAYHLGATTIVLLGLDMDFSRDGASHWHEGYAAAPTHRRHFEKMLPYFPSILKPLKLAGVKVINANLSSRVECFEKIALGRAHLVQE